jgi:D-alanine-D-alanine ligase
VSLRVAVIYNEPAQDRYAALGEQKAVDGVLVAVKAVHKALTRLEYDTQLFPLSPPIGTARDALRRIDADVVFNLFEGFAGLPETEADVAAIVAELGLACTGCPSTALSLALDKTRAKKILLANGLPTPRFVELTPLTLSLFDLEYPCIVKPAAEDASHGLSEDSVVLGSAGLERQVSRIAESYGGRALVEEYIDGREFNDTVLGNDAPVVLPPSEIVYTLPDGVPRILTFSAKWDTKSLYYKSSMPVCPADIDEITRRRISDSALAAFEALGCTGYARVDFRMADDGIPQIIEVNPNPDLSPGYGAALQAQKAGMPYHRLIERIVKLALERRPVESRN